MDSTPSVSNPPSCQDSTSSGFLERLKCHDAQAWQQMVRIYGPLIYHWCCKHSVRAADAADVFQEVLTSVASAIGGFRRDDHGGRFRGWLWIITKRKIQDHYRRLAKGEQARGGTDADRWLRNIPDHPDSEPADEAERASTGDCTSGVLETVRAQFEERTWRAFWQVTVDRRQVRDVAADLGMTANSVRQAKSRVLRRVRAILAELGEAAEFG